MSPRTWERGGGGGGGGGRMSTREANLSGLANIAGALCPGIN